MTEPRPTFPFDPIRHDQRVRDVISRWRHLCSQVRASSVSPNRAGNVLSAQNRPHDRADFAPLPAQTGTGEPVRTLIACSGGADSTALTLILALACRNSPDTLVLGHIVHDMREPSLAQQDADHVHAMGTALGIPVVTRSISCKDAGSNAESLARARRYDALHDIAYDHACPAIATAHHADDQLETVLMRLFRGSGLKGLSGIAPIRRLSPDYSIIRPMLGISRADAVNICRLCNTDWQHDTTNDDLSRSRAYIRHTLAPLIHDRFERAAEHVSTAADLVSNTHKLVQSHADQLYEAAVIERSNLHITLDRRRLHESHAITLGELTRAVILDLSENIGMDRVTQPVIASLIDAILSSDGSTKTIQTGFVEWTITREHVTAAKSGE
ncbi:MAG: tRNA lysidine(34) synthetase TilS [Phycisphaeraceae bacterium]|nr:tRNA lysidine(34) synthetase TilS [Phycisphaerales bacterium]MCB9860630.1 tRNA lysidine(34) synthetase TilS [Phycisphaeraceae bacterium]